MNVARATLKDFPDVSFHAGWIAQGLDQLKGRNNRAAEPKRAI